MQGLSEWLRPRGARRVALIISLLIHGALAAAITASTITETKTNPSRIGSFKRVDSLSPRLHPQPTIDLKIIDLERGHTPQSPQFAAGPLVSSQALEKSSVPERPKKLQTEQEAQAAGAEVPAKPLTGLLIGPDWVPPQVTRLRARIWIDHVGIPTRAELLDPIGDPEAEKLIIEAMMAAIYIPAERGGVTVASVATFEFVRAEGDHHAPLVEQAPTKPTPLSAK